jgi:hypothetical protein
MPGKARTNKKFVASRKGKNGRKQGGQEYLEQVGALEVPQHARQRQREGSSALSQVRYHTSYLCSPHAAAHVHCTALQQHFPWQAMLCVHRGSVTMSSHPGLSTAGPCCLRPCAGTQRAGVDVGAAHTAVPRNRAGAGRSFCRGVACPRLVLLLALLGCVCQQQAGHLSQALALASQR